MSLNIPRASPARGASFILAGLAAFTLAAPTLGQYPPARAAAPANSSAAAAPSTSAATVTDTAPVAVTAEAGDQQLTPDPSPAAASPSAAPAPITAPRDFPRVAGGPPAPASAVTPTSARVELHSRTEGARLELRSKLAGGPWQLVCTAPCGAVIEVDGREARVTGPGMTPSNPFRIAPGWGTARFRVDAGARAARSAGVAAFVGGAALAVGGMAVYGMGRLEDDQGLEVAGIVTLVTAGVAVATALPLLRLGGTRIHDERGRRIAGVDGPPRF